mmetsp:Transcript_64947/g.127521  ORF Transcript_64947/g.127521 Transcript_64947/m.127521 type:complete len:269 (-) Transcript_64947:189-995(-)
MAGRRENDAGEGSGLREQNQQRIVQCCVDLSVRNVPCENSVGNATAGVVQSAVHDHPRDYLAPHHTVHTSVGAPRMSAPATTHRLSGCCSEGGHARTVRGAKVCGTPVVQPAHGAQAARLRCRVQQGLAILALKAAAACSGRRRVRRRVLLGHVEDPLRQRRVHVSDGHEKGVVAVLVVDERAVPDQGGVPAVKNFCLSKIVRPATVNKSIDLCVALIRPGVVPVSTNSSDLVHSVINKMFDRFIFFTKIVEFHFAATDFNSTCLHAC